MRCLWLICILFFVLSLGCTQKDPSPPIEDNSDYYYLNGDLKTFFKDSKRNLKSFITTDNYKDFSKYSRYNTIVYKSVVKAEGESSNYNQSIENNSASEKNVLEDFNPKNKKVDILKTSDPNKYLLTMTFDPEEEFIENCVLKKQEDNTLGVHSCYGNKYEVVHYSMSKDKYAFSFVLYSEYTKTFDDGSSLKFQYYVVHYFMKLDHFNKNVQITNTQYNYLYGPGVKLRWDKSKKLDIHLCGKKPVEMQDLIFKNMSVWDDPLKNYLNYELKVAEEYPPLGDVSTNCIYAFEDIFFQDKRGDEFTGETLSIPNFNTHKFNSIYILLNYEAYKKRLSYYDNTDDANHDFGNTIAHEFGHFWGLSHMHDPMTMSLMNYAPQRTYSVYDKNAIHYLYSDKDF